MLTKKTGDALTKKVKKRSQLESWLLKVAATCLFYVPRVVLGVGIPRARNSECHPGHSFTGTTHAVHIGTLGTALHRRERY